MTMSAKPGASAASRLQRPPAWEVPRTGLGAAPAPALAALVALVIYLLFRFSMLQDFIFYRFRFNSKYQYVCIPILLLAVGAVGRIFPVLRSSLGIWMTAFTVWMGACIPTSSWRRGSFGVFKDYILNDYALFVGLAGVACVLLALKVAVNSLAVVMPVFILILAATSEASRYGARAMLTFGVYGNPNSIAAHLLFLAPFVVCFVLMGNGALRRLVGTAALLAGLAFFFRSGSRGGLLALVIVMAAVFTCLPVSKKLVAILLLLVVVPAAIALIPEEALIRYRTIFSADTSALSMTVAESEMVGAAMGSTDIRKLLFKESVSISLHNPIFGVGPGQFANYNADAYENEGRRANWLVCHNGYTQVSSEMGLVGFVFYMGLLLTTGLTLWRIRKRLRELPLMRPLYLVASCLLASWLSYCAFSVFDYVAYYQYVPLMAGLACGLKTAVEGELASSPAASATGATNRQVPAAAWAGRPLFR